nr:unnamed protein product [Haemonchus contortus]
MTKVAKKDDKRETSIPRRKAGGGPIVKTSVKENERIARMKAAREAYSKLSQQRSTKPTTSRDDHSKKADGQQSEIPTTSKPPKLLTTDHLKSLLDTSRGKCEKNNERQRSSSANAAAPGPTSFKPMASSLEMIRSGGIRAKTGRASSIASGRGSLLPRPSLLPLGINVFDSNVSLADKMKVKEFVESLCKSKLTPKKHVPHSFGADSNFDLQSVRSSRTVRFCVESTIEEQRESGGDEIVSQENIARKNLDPDTRSSSENVAPQSILKKKKDRVTAENNFPRRAMSDKQLTPIPRRSSRLSAVRTSRKQMLVPSVSSESDVSVLSPEREAPPPDQCTSIFTQSYTQLFNMTDKDWKDVERIMLNELIELLKEKKKWLDEQTALQPEDSSCSLISLPEDCFKAPEPKKAGGFRRVLSNRSNADLQANQVLIQVKFAVIDFTISIF